MWPTEALLTVIHKAAPRECITEERMVEMTGRTAGAITASCTLLRKHGLIKKTDKGCHKLTDAGRAAVLQGITLRTGGKGQKHTGRLYRKDSLRERAWLAMRILGRFSIADLVMRAAQGSEKSIDTNLRDYCRNLIKAGYLTELPTREPSQTGRGLNRYMLIPEMNTGPKPPVHRQQRGGFYDPNLERDVPFLKQERA